MSSFRVHNIPTFAKNRPADKRVVIVDDGRGQIALIDPGSANCTAWNVRALMRMRLYGVTVDEVMTFTTHGHPDHNSARLQKTLRKLGLGGRAYGPTYDDPADMSTPHLIRKSLVRMRQIDRRAADETFGILGRNLAVAEMASWFSQCWSYGPDQKAPDMKPLDDLEDCNGLTALHLPGHTRGELGFFHHGDNGRNVIFGGDLIQFGGTGLPVAPTSAYLSFMLTDSDVLLGLQSVARLLALVDKDVLHGYVPSHGPWEPNRDCLRQRLENCLEIYSGLIRDAQAFGIGEVKDFLRYIQGRSDVPPTGKSFLERRSNAAAILRAAHGR